MTRQPTIPATLAQDAFVAGSEGVHVRVYRLHAGRDRRQVLVVGHCNGFAAGAYLPLLERLTAVADVFAFDQRGHGGADAPDPAHPASFSPDSLAGDVASVINAVAAQRPDARLHYFGHSLSAAAMLRLAIIRPADYTALPLRAVALMEPPVFPDAQHPLFELCTTRTIDLVARTRRRRTRWPDTATFMSGLRRYPVFAAFAPGMLEAVAAATLRTTADGVALICDPATEAAIFTTWGRPVLFPYLSQIPGAHRVQLIGADPAAPDPDWVSMMMGSVAERLPQARFDVIPHRGHLWPFEAPEAVLHWISTTLLA